jgi:hypothetical protein
MSRTKFHTHSEAQYAHRAYPALPEDHTRKEERRACVDGTDDCDVKTRLLLGGEKTLRETLRQALELHVVLRASRLLNTYNRVFLRG